MDKHKTFGILLGQNPLVKYGSEVIRMAEKDSELFNYVLRCNVKGKSCKNKIWYNCYRLGRAFASASLTGI